MVFNNSVLGFRGEMEMKAGGYPSRTAPELHGHQPLRVSPRACGGITGIRVEKASEVDEALQRAFSIDGPVLVDVVVAKRGACDPAADQVSGAGQRLLACGYAARHHQRARRRG